MSRNLGGLRRARASIPSRLFLCWLRTLAHSCISATGLLVASIAIAVAQPGSQGAQATNTEKPHSAPPNQANSPSKKISHHPTQSEPHVFSPWTARFVFAAQSSSSLTAMELEYDIGSYFAISGSIGVSDEKLRTSTLRTSTMLRLQAPLRGKCLLWNSGIAIGINYGKEYFTLFGDRRIDASVFYALEVYSEIKHCWGPTVKLSLGNMTAENVKRESIPTIGISFGWSF